MLTKEILAAVDSVSNEKGVPKEVVCDAIEVALATATKKRRRDDAEFRVSIDWETGDYETFRTWLVVDPVELDFRPRFWGSCPRFWPKSTHQKPKVKLFCNV